MRTRREIFAERAAKAAKAVPGPTVEGRAVPITLHVDERGEIATPWDALTEGTFAIQQLFVCRECFRAYTKAGPAAACCAPRERKPRRMRSNA